MYQSFDSTNLKHYSTAAQKVSLVQWFATISRYSHLFTSVASKHQTSWGPSLAVAHTQYLSSCVPSIHHIRQQLLSAAGMYCIGPMVCRMTFISGKQESIPNKCLHMACTTGHIQNIAAHCIALHLVDPKSSVLHNKECSTAY